MVGTAGALYGISGGGVPKSCGTSACGMVFQLTPPVKSGGNWTLSTIYKFLGGSDGGNPVGRLLVGNKGAIYGVTFNGGNAASSCDVMGCGTVFQLTPPVKTGGSWTKKTIYSFSGPDGANPQAGVISDKLGNLHGTTSGGGDSNALAGIVFELSPPAVTGNPWTETLIHAFNPFDGRHDGYAPQAELVRTNGGALYGTTTNGSCSLICGTLFEAIPPNSEAPIDFFGGIDGSDPGQIILRNGIIYGLTTLGGNVRCDITIGCGEVFEWNGAKNVLFSFDVASGRYPDAIVFDSTGALFVAAEGGGSNPSACSGGGCGTILKLSKSGSQWTPTKFHDFTGGADGALPSSLINNAGVLYGTTLSGGNLKLCQGSGCGTVFKIQ